MCYNRQGPRIVQGDDFSFVTVLYSVNKFSKTRNSCGCATDNDEVCT